MPEGLTEYENGPLPDELKDFAIIAKNGKEFAFFFEDALPISPGVCAPNTE